MSVSIDHLGGDRYDTYSVKSVFDEELRSEAGLDLEGELSMGRQLLQVTKDVAYS